MASTREPIRDWRHLYTASGPSADSPLNDRQDYLRLRYQEILRLAKGAIAGILERTAEDGPGGGSEASMLHSRLVGELSLLKQQARTLRAASGPERVDAVDIEAVARAYLVRAGLDVPNESLEPGAVKPRGVPRFDEASAVKREWARTELGKHKSLSDKLGKLAGKVEWQTPSGVLAIRSVQKLLAIIVACVRDLSTLMAITCSGGRREDMVRKTAIDDFEAEVKARQGTAGMPDADRPRLETVQGVVADVKAAREGDFWAYFRLVAYSQRSEMERMPYELTPEHIRMYKAFLAHLKCKACGEWHSQSWVPRYDSVLGKPVVAPVTCPHCGQEDCAGAKNHFIHAPRGFGKTEADCITTNWGNALMQHRGYRGEVLVIGANLPEGRKRLGMRVQFMRTVGHKLCFPKYQSSKQHPGQAMTIKGEQTPSILAYGIESVPPGAHPEQISTDDADNERGMTHPAIAAMVESKVSNVINYSKQPWTVFNWLGTPWVENDADHRLQKQAEANPKEWAVCVVKVTGEYPHFVSPWPAKWSNEDLCLMYEQNEYPFRRGMMMQRITAADRFWEKVGLWIYADDRRREKLPPEEAKTIQWTTRQQIENLRRLLALDPGFTDKTKATKNRSPTAINIGGIDPDTHLKYLLFSWSDFISPGRHIEEVANRCQEWRCQHVVIEKDKMTNETAEGLRAKGLSVDTYSPAAFGSKHMRKQPLASAYNQGFAFVHGYVTYEHGQVVARPIEPHRKLYNWMVGYPGIADGKDEGDAHEMQIRKIDEYWGGPVTKREQGAASDGRSDLQRFRDSLYEDPPAEEQKDSDAEFIGAMAEMDRDAVGALGLMED